MTGKSKVLAKRPRKASNFPTASTLAEMRRRLRRWFERHGRRFPWRNASLSTYQYVIAEVLLQRTHAEKVACFFPKFIKEFPSWKKLGSVRTPRLQRYLQPMGLWRRKAVSIRALARTMGKRNGRFPRERDAIEALPGVGQYIANAILLFSRGQPEPLLDVNMARVLERVFGPRKLADIRYDPYLQELSKKVVRCSNPAEMNWAILDLAATICLIQNPRCGKCPLKSMCLAAKDTR